ncbi:MAG: 30S ribosome-binding factor RbfA [Bryobacteraceae bacterium]
MDPLRTQRVSEAMREELSELIRFESADVRLAGVDVSSVVIAPDGSRADVLVSLPPGQEARRLAMEGLMHAKAYLRKQLAARIELFRMPELRFVADTEPVSDRPLSKLLRRVRRGRPKTDAEPGPEGPA